jgi:ABC-type branched-subunit amino acid transport system ATPase component
VAGLAVLRLPEPPRGANERLAVLGDLEVPLGPRVPVRAALRRLRRIATFRAFLSALGVLGLVTVGIPTYVNLVLRRDLGLSTEARSVVHSLTALGGIAGVALGSRYADRLFGKAPRRVLLLVSAAVAVHGVTLPVSLFMPNAALYAAVDVVNGAVVAAAMVPALSVLTSVTPYRLRSVGFAVIGGYVALVGGIGGVLLVGTLSNHLGPRTALTVAVPPLSFLAAALLARGAASVDADVAAVARAVDDERAGPAAHDGDRPLLEVRGLEVGYGSMPVLFGVDLDVREGEVLALLGTNGAGKSTLLRAISGLSPADRGVIRFAGEEITFLTPRQRVHRGIVQVRGGQGVLPDLTVRDNLLAGTYPFIRDGARVEASVAGAVERFPILSGRLDHPAGSLSGGEQQMLAIAKALVLEPRLLVIDELSLGLAPTVVEHLLAMLERLRAAGQTMIVVEQSLNVAVSIADRAVFLEKGVVRFEGSPRELLDRGDLARAVFLGDGED